MDLGTRAELRDAAGPSSGRPPGLARTLHPVHRFESWRRMLEGSTRAEPPEVAGTLEYWPDKIAQTPAAEAGSGADA